MLDSGAGVPLHRQMIENGDLSPRKRAARVAREQRLAAALRDNLRRRKEQARGRAEDTPADASADLSSAPLSGKNHRHGGTTAD